MRRLTIAIAIAALGALVLGGASADAKPRMKLKRIGRFQSPTYVTSAPGVPGVVVVERGGRIRLVQGRKRRTFTSIAGNVSTGGERGLLSVAFAPDYAASRLLYVYFTNGGRRSRDRGAARRCRRPARRPRATLRPIVIVPHPNQSNHNGGQLQFGPDGMLYAGTGDGGGAGDQPDNAQNPNSRLGKLLRIDPGSGAVQVYSTRPPQPLPLLLRPAHDPGTRASRSATSARIASTRSTTCLCGGCRAPTSAGTISKASLRSPEPIRPRPVAP